jgi:hypothetical protein
VREALGPAGRVADLRVRPPSGIVVDSYGLVQSCQIVSWNVPSVIGIGFCTDVHGSKWPISNCVEMLVLERRPRDDVRLLAVEYSGW